MAPLVEVVRLELVVELAVEPKVVEGEEDAVDVPLRDISTDAELDADIALERRFPGGAEVRPTPSPTTNTAAVFESVAGLSRGVVIRSNRAMPCSLIEDLRVWPWSSSLAHHPAHRNAEGRNPRNLQNI